MFDCNLIPSIILLSFPMFIKSVIISILYTINVIWISHNYDVVTLSGVAIGEVFLIIIGISTILGFSSSLSTLCNIAFKNQDFEMIGIFLQRSIIISHILLVCLMIVFWFSDYILIYLLHQPSETSFYANIYLRFMIISLWILFIWTNLRRFLQCQRFYKYIIITIICGLLGEILGLYLFQTVWNYQYYGAIISLCFGFLCQFIAMWILIVIIGYHNAYHINKLDASYHDKPSAHHHLHGLSHIYSTGALKQIHENKQENKEEIPKIYFYFPGWYGINCKAMLNLKGFKYFLSLCIPSICRIYNELWCFTFVEIIIAGWISIEYLTAQSLTHNLLTLIIKMQISIASATSILITNAVAKKNTDLSKNIWDTALIYTFVITVIICGLIYWQKQDIVKFYILMGENVHSQTDMECRYSIYNLMNNISLPWMCIYLLLNSQLLVNQGVMQCIGKISYCTLLNLSTYCIIAIPLALITVFVTDWGLYGLWFSVCICLFIQCLVFIWKRYSIDWMNEIKNYKLRKTKYKYNDFEDREVMTLRSWNTYRYPSINKICQIDESDYKNDDEDENIIDNIDWFVDYNEYNESDDDDYTALRRASSEMADISYGSMDM